MIFPMKSNFRVAVLIKENETAYTINNRFLVWLNALVYNPTEAVGRSIAHRDITLAILGLGTANVIVALGVSLKLPTNPDGALFEVNIIERQTDELRDSKSCV